MNTKTLNVTDGLDVVMNVLVRVTEQGKPDVMCTIVIHCD